METSSATASEMLTVGVGCELFMKLKSLQRLVGGEEADVDNEVGSSGGGGDSLLAAAWKDALWSVASGWELHHASLNRGSSVAARRKEAVSS